jgi:hypothetical protein
MKKLTLTVTDIATLKKAENKIHDRKPLNANERYALTNFLASLPSSETLLNEKFPLDETFEIKVFDIQEMWPHMEKWISLFNDLPKNGSKFYPNAGWLDAEESKDFWKTNVIIVASFIPSFAYSKRNKGENQIIAVNLKTDGTATFQFWTVEDAKDFPELYNFKGTWKEAYLLTVKTLMEGWPHTKFPEEFEPLLKK